MESCLMTVTCRPQLSALARIIAVLHMRQADIRALQYAVGADSAEIAIEVASADADRLAEQVRRIVDVTAVRVAMPAPVAVAS